CRSVVFVFCFFLLFYFVFFLFFFSSRRRHTRCYRDWSSDVCSSDLFLAGVFILGPRVLFSKPTEHQLIQVQPYERERRNVPHNRSEERRVGKECRSQWSADD